MFRGLIVCLEKVWNWFEGLVPRENAGESWLVRAGFLADLRNEPRPVYGVPRPVLALKVKMALSGG